MGKTIKQKRNQDQNFDIYTYTIDHEYRSLKDERQVKKYGSNMWTPMTELTAAKSRAAAVDADSRAAPPARGSGEGLCLRERRCARFKALRQPSTHRSSVGCT